VGSKPAADSKPGPKTLSLKGQKMEAPKSNSEVSTVVKGSQKTDVAISAQKVAGSKPSTEEETGPVTLDPTDQEKEVSEVDSEISTEANDKSVLERDDLISTGSTGSDPLWIEPEEIQVAQVARGAESTVHGDVKPRGSASVAAIIVVAHTSIQVRTDVCVDTGADVTICTKKFITQFLGPQALSHVDSRGRLPTLISASHHPMKALGRLHLFIYLGLFKLDIKVIVQDEGDYSNFLLGSDAFYGKIIIDRGRYLTFGNPKYPPVPIRYRLSNNKAKVVGCVQIAPRTSAVVQVKVTNDSQLTGKEVYLKAASYANQNVESWLDGGLITNPVCDSVSEIDSDGIARVMVNNSTDEIITFTNEFELASASLIREEDIKFESENEDVYTIRKVSEPSNESMLDTLTDERLKKMLPTLHLLTPEEVYNINFIHDKGDLRDLLDGTGDGIPLPPAAEPLDDYADVDEWLSKIEKDHLTEREWNLLKAVLLKNKEAFSLSKTDIGCFRYFKAELPLKPGTGYLYAKPYPLPPKHKEEANKKITELLEQGIIRPSKSPHSSNIVVVNKKAVDGVNQYRVCVDLRRVNENTIPMRFPNLQVDEALAKLQGAKFRSSLDFCNAFHQIALHEDSIPVTAFTVGTMQMEYVRLPFGHVNAMQLWSCALHLVCEGIPQANAYADDLIISTPDDHLLTSDQMFEEHIRHIDTLLRRIIDAGMKLKAHKCQWAYGADKPMDWLGHTLQDNYLRPQEAKQRAIREFPVPNSDKQAMAFIGVCSFHRKWVPGFAKIAKPIHEVIVHAKKNTFRWTDTAQKAFEQLKNILCSPPVLRLPRLNCAYILYSDASHVAIGVVLCQEDLRTKTPFVCEYGSRMFNQAELKMSTPCKELLAIVYGLNRWRHWFLGNPVHVYTDCKAWTFLKVQTGIAGKIARLGLLTQEFDISVSYIPGEKNKAADGLSRAFDDGQVALDDQIAPRHPALEHLSAPTLSEGEVLKLTDYLEMCEPYAEKFIQDVKNGKFDKSVVDEEVEYISRVLEVCQLLHFDRHYSGPPIAEELEEELRIIEEAIDADSVMDNADGASSISSLSVFGELPTTDGDVKSMAYNVRFMTLNDTAFSLDAFIHAQESDPFCSKLMKRLKKGSRVIARRGFFLKKGVLKRQFTTKDGQIYTTICVPQSLVNILLQSAHGNLLTGHHGSTKFLLDMSRKYYWKGMSKDVLNYQRQCVACQFNDKYPVNFKMGAVIEPNSPLHIVYYDIIPSLPRAKCGSYALLLFYDGFSRFVAGVPLASEKADYIVRKVVTHFIQPFGAPWALHSDNGRNLDGHAARYLARLLGTRKTSTPPYTPNSNPCETMCAAVGMLIRKALFRSDQKQWPLCLPFVLHALNNTVHSATGYTPVSLFFGRPEDRPLVPLVPWDAECVTHDEYYTKIRRFQELAFQIARRRSHALVCKRREKVNAKARDHRYQVGDYVLVLNKAPALGIGQAKLRAKYIGPFRVIKTYPKSLVVVPWTERKEVDGLIGPPPLFELPNRVNVEPFKARIVNVSHCKPFRGEPDKEIISDAHLKEFLKMLESDNVSSLSSTVTSRDDDEPHQTESFDDFDSSSDSSLPDSDTDSSTSVESADDESSDDDDAPGPGGGGDDHVQAPEDEVPPAGPDQQPNRTSSSDLSVVTVEPKSEHSTISSPAVSLESELAELLDNIHIVPHERRVLTDHLTLDRGDDRQDLVRDMLTGMRDPDPEVAAAAGQDFRLLLDGLMWESGATRQHDFDDENVHTSDGSQRDRSGGSEVDEKPSSIRTLAEASTTSDSFMDEPVAGPSKPRKGPFKVQTRSFDISVDRENTPGRPQVVRHGSDGRTLSGVPPTQDPPEMLDDWVADQARRTRTGDHVESTPIHDTNVRTRSGRISRPPLRFDPSEERIVEQARRESLGTSKKAKPQAAAEEFHFGRGRDRQDEASFNPTLSNSESSSDSKNSKVVTPDGAASDETKEDTHESYDSATSPILKPATPDGAASDEAERDKQESHDSAVSPDLNLSKDSAEKTTSSGSEDMGLDELFKEQLATVLD